MSNFEREKTNFLVTIISLMVFELEKWWVVLITLEVKLCKAVCTSNGRPLS